MLLTGRCGLQQRAGKKIFDARTADVADKARLKYTPPPYLQPLHEGGFCMDVDDKVPPWLSILIRLLDGTNQIRTAYSKQCGHKYMFPLHTLHTPPLERNKLTYA